VRSVPNCAWVSRLTRDVFVLRYALKGLADDPIAAAAPAEQASRN
jgi:hypothetical protein